MKYLMPLNFRSAGKLLALTVLTSAFVGGGVALMLDVAAASPTETVPVLTSLQAADTALWSFVLSCRSVLGPEATIGVLLLLAAGLWVKILPRRSFKKPEPSLVRSFGKSDYGLDRSLPRSLRRDGWWLES